MWQFLKNNPVVTLLSLIFVVVSLSLIVSSGWWCQNGVCELRLAEWQMHDSLWHISLAKLAFHDFPFRNPFYSGSTLSGYNYGFDLLLYGLTKLSIDPFASYFWLLPSLIVLIYLSVAWRYIMVSTRQPLERILTAFFLFVCTSLSYLANLFATGSVSGSTLRGFPVVTSLHPPSMFLNLPYALSLPLILLMLTWLFSNKPTSPLKILLWAFVTFGLKFYAGVTGLILLILFPQQKGNLARLLYFGIGAALAYIFFYYRSDSSGFPFVFSPLSLPHVVIDDVHLFYNHQLTLARYYLYENLSALPLRLIGIEGLTILLFLLLNWGTRLISYFLAFFTPTDPRVNKLLLAALFLSMIPVLMLQRGGWYNTMQFMYYGTFLLSIATARLLAHLSQKHHKLALILSALVIIPLLPSTLEQLSYPFKPHNQLTVDERLSLSVLKSAPNGVVHVNRPWAKRALIPALAEKEMYYLDTDQLMLFLPGYQSRLDHLLKYSGGSITQVPADYYYLYKLEPGSPDSYQNLKSNTQLELLYDSPTIAVFGRTDL